MNASLHRETERDERLYATVRSAALNSLHHARSSRGVANEADTLADAMELVGVGVPEMARQMSLPKSVVARLVRGDIMGASIPRTLTEMLSRLLRQSIDWTLARYPASLIPAYGNAEGVTHHRPATLTFQDTILDAPDIEDEQRTFWLEEA